MEDFGGLIWFVSGFIAWLFIVVPMIMKGEDVGTDPAAGQAFIILMVLGPIGFVALIWFYIDEAPSRAKVKDEQKRKDDMSEEEAWEVTYKAYMEKENDRNWEMYIMTRDDEFRNDISSNHEIPEKRKLTFHGGCLGCDLQEKSIKECWTCQYYPGNWNTYPSKN